MPSDLVSSIGTIGGFALGCIGTFIAASSYHQKRRDEARDRQQRELDRQQQELDREKLLRQEEFKKFATAEIKEYAAQRDFSHLRRQYVQLNKNLAFIHKENERWMINTESDLKEIKQLMQAILTHQGDTQSGILRYQKRDDG